MAERESKEEPENPAERIGDLLESLWKNIDFKHIEAVTHDTATTVKFEVYLIEDARIPPMFVEKESDRTADDSSGDDLKTVVVDMMSGNSIEVQISPPYIVKSIKVASAKTGTLLGSTIRALVEAFTFFP